MSTVHLLLLGYPSLLDTVCPLLLGIFPYVIGLVFINCWLLSVLVLLVSLCPCIVGYFVFTFAFFIISYKVSVIVGSVHRVLCLCPSIVGYCRTICCWRFISLLYWLLSARYLNGMCSYIVGDYTQKQLPILYTWNTETGNKYMFTIYKVC